MAKGMSVTREEEVPLFSTNEGGSGIRSRRIKFFAVVVIPLTIIFVAVRARSALVKIFVNGNDANAVTNDDSPSPSPVTQPPTSFYSITESTLQYEHTTWLDIGYIAATEAAAGAFLVLMFETLRHRLKRIYSPRSFWSPGLNITNRPNWMGGWLWPTVRLSGERTRDLVGLDSYMLLRFIRLCMRLSLFASGMGVFILIPIYTWISLSSQSTLGIELSQFGFDAMTLNKIDMGQVLWVPCVCSVMFTLHFMYLTDREYSKFVEWRVSFFSHGSVASCAGGTAHRRDYDQMRATVKIRGLPNHLRSNATLTKYLESIFPGEVYCVNVQVRIDDLIELHEERLNVVNKLERAMALKAATGGRDQVIRVYPDMVSQILCWGGETVEPLAYYTAKLDALNKQMLLLQEESSAIGTCASFAAATHASEPADGISESDPLTQEARYQEDGLMGLEQGGKASNVKAAAATGFKPLCSQMCDDALSLITHLCRGLSKDFQDFASAHVYHGIAGSQALLESVASITVHPRTTTVAFVTMKSELTALVMATGTMSHKQYTMQTTPAPYARDIIWKNITWDARTRKFRKSVAFISFTMFAALWSVIVAVISCLGDSGNSFYAYIGISDNISESAWASYIVTFVPSVLQLGLLSFVPVICQFVAESYEGKQSEMEVQRVILSRYFAFCILNIFITVGAGSIKTYFDEFVSEPYGIPVSLAETFPSTAAYFVAFILIKLLFGLPWELARAMTITQHSFAYLVSDKRQWTKRSLRSAYMSFPALLYGWVYPSLLSVMVICLTYIVITPVVSLFSLAFFLVAEVVYKNQALYVYNVSGDSGGLLWNSAFKRLMVGLIFSHVLLMGYFTIKDAIHIAIVPLLLVVADCVFWSHCYHAYEKNSTAVSLEWAARKHHRNIAQDIRIWENFSKNMYEQPSLRAEPVLPEPLDKDSFGSVWDDPN